MFGTGISTPRTLSTVRWQSYSINTRKRWPMADHPETRHEQVIMFSSRPITGGPRVMVSDNILSRRIELTLNRRGFLESQSQPVCYARVYFTRNCEVNVLLYI